MSPRDELREILERFDELHYVIDERGDSVFVSNLKEIDGMESAELITYLQDAGYRNIHFMDSAHANGSIAVSKPRTQDNE